MDRFPESVPRGLHEQHSNWSRELESDEAASLAAFVDVLRGSLRELDLATFRHFIEASRDAVEGAEDPESWEDDDLQAAVSLADELLAPQPTLDRPQTLRTLEEFIAFVESLGDDAVPTTVLDHYPQHQWPESAGACQAVVLRVAALLLQRHRSTACRRASWTSLGTLSRATT